MSAPCLEDVTILTPKIRYLFQHLKLIFTLKEVTIIHILEWVDARKLT